MAAEQDSTALDSGQLCIRLWVCHFAPGSMAAA